MQYSQLDYWLPLAMRWFGMNRLRLIFLCTPLGISARSLHTLLDRAVLLKGLSKVLSPAPRQALTAAPSLLGCERLAGGSASALLLGNCSSAPAAVSPWTFAISCALC